MANQYVNKVVLNNVVKLDLTSDTITADKLLSGYTAHDASGAPVVGSMQVQDAYAIIIAHYPAGNVCTCSKSGTTLTAKDTSGTAIFLIPTTGTWTVSCSGKTQTVNITTYGQVEEVTISLTLDILTKTSGLASGYSVSGKSIIPAVDVTPYSTMTIVGKKTYAAQSSYTMYCFLSKTAGGDSASYVVISQTTEKTYTLDIRALTGNYYFTTEGTLSKSGRKIISTNGSFVTADIYSIQFS